ncbi:MAG: hypothetical protein EBS53_06805 [Bacteroidetes bacterium]|nr:hypothetical protein [Bacteroidota bacterium]
MPYNAAPVPRSMKIVDNNYVLMNDVFNLNPGMTYEQVLANLKISPIEVYSNVADNCIVLKYLGKRRLRIHDDGTETIAPPLIFYPSVEPRNLTYGDVFELHLILDGSSKKLRSFFTNIDPTFVMESNGLLKRAKLVCNSPEQIQVKIREWFPTVVNRPTLNNAVKNEGFPGLKLKSLAK